MRKIYTIILFGVISFQSAYSAEADQWNYIGLSRLKIVLEDLNDDVYGYALDAKYGINESLFLGGKYQQYGIATTDVERILIGIGGRYNISENISPYAQLSYVYVDSTESTFSVSIKYWLANIGVSGSTNNIAYKVGLSYYESISEGLDSDSGYFTEIFYSFNNKVSAGLDVESVDSDDIYNISVRYHF